MTVKINPGAQVNTIPLSKYWELYPHKIDETRLHKPGTLSPTSHTWISHYDSPKPFLGHFMANVQHATLPRLYPTTFYVLEDATSPHILLTYATSERLGILEFKIPNLVAQPHIDTLVSLPSLPQMAWGRLPNASPSVTHCWTLISHSANPSLKAYVAWERLLPHRYTSVTRRRPTSMVLGTNIPQPLQVCTNLVLNLVLANPSPLPSQHSRWIQLRWLPLALPLQSRTSLPWGGPSQAPLTPLATCLGLIPSGQNPLLPQSSMPGGRYLSCTGNR